MPPAPESQSIPALRCTVDDVGSWQWFALGGAGSQCFACPRHLADAVSGRLMLPRGLFHQQEVSREAAHRRPPSWATAFGDLLDEQPRPHVWTWSRVSRLLLPEGLSDLSDFHTPSGPPVRDGPASDAGPAPRPDHRGVAIKQKMDDSGLGWTSVRSSARARPTLARFRFQFVGHCDDWLGRLHLSCVASRSAALLGLSVRRHLANLFGPHSVDLGVDLVDSADFGPKLVESCRIRLEVGRSRPIIGRLRASFSRILPQSRSREAPDFGRVWPDALHPLALCEGGRR